MIVGNCGHNLKAMNASPRFRLWHVPILNATRLSMRSRRHRPTRSLDADRSPIASASRRKRGCAPGLLTGVGNLRGPFQGRAATLRPRSPGRQIASGGPRKLDGGTTGGSIMAENVEVLPPEQEP